ncbi:Uncharacterized protein PBTT_09794 [Plasmodiophora brassicae]|uniref:Uncharacterized protein n=1 Tax=Plasmodiophora brassicae TaxID=37360 RepID=A0A0G4J1A0_PLABS|nr:hypothetical protein PBRA_002014 [Plasmodiophora brassicae]SPR01426.1 unnamed protein product [Plasmodiophora brassicae]
MPQPPRTVLGTLSQNTTRAERLQQWKETRDADSKKRKAAPETATTTTEQLRKKVKAQAEELECKTALISELQSQIEKDRATKVEEPAPNDELGKWQDRVRRAEHELDVAETSNRELRRALRSAVADHDNDQDAIAALRAKCSQIVPLQSFVAELSLFLKCATAAACEPVVVVAAPAEPARPSRELVRARKLHRAEIAVLVKELAVVRGKAATLEAEVARLQFENEVLEQQALSTVQSGVEYITKLTKTHYEERQVDRDEMTAFVETVQAPLSDSLDKSMEKIKQLQAELAQVKERNRVLEAQSTKAATSDPSD